MATRWRAAAAGAALFAGVMTADLRTQGLAQDQGAAGAWQKIQKLTTTASVLYTYTHPDDENGGMLTALSRGQGVRVALLSMNRGEGGDNAIGSELFDALGLIRTEEMLAADRYYGADTQYFTTLVDFGFSKRLEEGIDKSGRDNILRDLVRIIRMDRPLVVISHWHPSERAGHGHHQTMGVLTPEAFAMAGDRKAFPELAAEGIQPWRPLKLYAGQYREDEDWTVRFDAGEYNAAIGDSFQTLARTGLSLMRSQNSGRLNVTSGPAPAYYKRAASHVVAPEREKGFFDGIDTSLGGLYATLGRTPPPDAARLLGAIEEHVRAAASAFRMLTPSSTVPELARGLRATREARQALAGDADVRFVLDVKERQFQDAINAALGIRFTVYAQPAGTPEPTGPMAAFMGTSVPMGPVVPGQSFEVRAGLTNRAPIELIPGSVTWVAYGAPWQVTGAAPLPATLGYNQTAAQKLVVTVPADAPLSRPYFRRRSIAETRYTTIDDPRQVHRPAREPALAAVAAYTVFGETVAARQTVQRWESQLPFGYVARELMVVPAVAVNVTPHQAVIPLKLAAKQINVQVELVGNLDTPQQGQVRLTAPAGWKVDPPSAGFAFNRAGERRLVGFTVRVPALENRDYRIEAVATVGAREFRDGYDIIQKRDLETRYLFHEAVTEVHGVDVAIAPDLSVGYVMGIGDSIPAAIAQLGVKVELLDERALAERDLGRFDAVVTGTRAYAVRDDLRTHNQRLLDYAAAGGNLIVLYNTQEFVPDKFAPFPAQLTARAEETSEEDAPVEILQPAAPVLQWPNRITTADFDGWVEQRGSKFWSAWDKAYTPMISTHDQKQAPQQGVWLTARHGRGHYSYVALAFHRQLPFGVPGAYRIVANLLSMGRAAGSRQ